MARRLSAVADKIDGRLIGADAEFGSVGTDSRSLPAGSLFVAIVGERFDGNDYVTAAAAKGAAGALVSREQDVALPQIAVADTRTAFGAMARAWRENFEIPVVAVTGSAGKTTVKELIASILGTTRKLCVTEGNLNNDIGVPLILMRLGDDDEALVVELGANHAGEIANLGRLVEPTVAVITNAGAAHLEGFGSISGVAAAKGELIDCLGPDGIAVLNADDAFFPEWRRRAGNRRVLSFGFGADADVNLQGEILSTDAGSKFRIGFPDAGTVPVELPLAGRANVTNALAAAAAASALDASEQEIQQGLARIRPVKGRLNRLSAPSGATLIDDSYNANPSAARAALDLLAECAGTRIFVLGDMLELGQEAPSLHRQIGEYACGRCDRFVAIGPLAKLAAGAFDGPSASYTDIEDAAAAIAEELGPEVTVLIKASRSMGLERLVAALAEPAETRRC